VEQSDADGLRPASDDVHGSLSDVGSVCDEEDLAGPSADSSSHCLVDVSATDTADLRHQGQLPNYCWVVLN